MRDGKMSAKRVDSEKEEKKGKNSIETATSGYFLISKGTKNKSLIVHFNKSSWDMP